MTYRIDSVNTNGSIHNFPLAKESDRHDVLLLGRGIDPMSRGKGSDSGDLSKPLGTSLSPVPGRGKPWDAAAVRFVL